MFIMLKGFPPLRGDIPFQAIIAFIRFDSVYKIISFQYSSFLSDGLLVLYDLTNDFTRIQQIQKSLFNSSV